MASATPGGAPGYDDDKEFGNNVTHLIVQTSQRLRGTYCPSLKSQATGGNQRKAASLLCISRDTLRYRLKKLGIAAD
jgi:DNA-binding protein Fis